MRRVVPCLVFLAVQMDVALGGELRVHLSEEMTTDAIAQLIVLLGSEDFDVREEATCRLKKLGVACRTQVEAARTSSDSEVRTRADVILNWIQTSETQRQFLVTLESSWVPALEKGVLAGPVMGVADVDARTAEVELIKRPVADGASDSERERGLYFLSRVQSADGKWDARALGAQLASDVDQTALALIAFLGAGHTEKVGRHKVVVADAVGWLAGRQRADGAVLPERWTVVDQVTHALAAWALCEAAGMANRPETKAAAQRAIDFVVLQQDPVNGGFARITGGTPDLFTTTMCVWALRSAKVAGLEVPVNAFEGVLLFLDLMEDKEHKTWRLVADGKPSAHAAILGTVCRKMLGWKGEDVQETATAALKAIGKPDAVRRDYDVLFTYMCTWLAFSQSGETWADWNESLKKTLKATQMGDGSLEGAWAPRGVWGGGGYVLSTALSTMSLEFYYVYLPIYK